METVIPIEFLFKVTTWVWWEWLLCPVTDHFSSQLMDDIEDQILSNPLKYFWTLTCVPCSTHLLCFLCENLKLNPYLNLNYICHLCISIFCNVWLFLNHLLVWKIIYTNQFGCLNRDENNNRKESNRPPYITQRDVTSNGGWLVISFLAVCWVVCGMSCSPDEMHQTYLSLFPWRSWPSGIGNTTISTSCMTTTELSDWWQKGQAAVAVAVAVAVDITHTVYENPLHLKPYPSVCGSWWGRHCSCCLPDWYWL